jgi:hypothetical protein
MGEIIAISAIVLIVGGAILYIIKTKKSGAKCIGCPHAHSCYSKGEACSCKSESMDEGKE